LYLVGDFWLELAVAEAPVLWGLGAPLGALFSVVFFGSMMEVNSQYRLLNIEIWRYGDNGGIYRQLQGWWIYRDILRNLWCREFGWRHFITISYSHFGQIMVTSLLVFIRAPFKGNIFMWIDGGCKMLGMTVASSRWRSWTNQLTTKARQHGKMPDLCPSRASINRPTPPLLGSIRLPCHAHANYHADQIPAFLGSFAPFLGHLGEYQRRQPLEHVPIVQTLSNQDDPVAGAAFPVNLRSTH